MRAVVLAVLAVLVCMSATACKPVPRCGSVPEKPAQIRAPDFFGALRVTAGHLRIPSSAFAVSKRSFESDDRTEWLGSCGPRFAPNGCSAYVVLRSPRVAAWVLLAQPSPLASTRGFRVLGGTVWKVRRRSVVLTNGFEIPYGDAFADLLDRSDGPRDALSGRQVGGSISIDPHTGEVVDVFLGGCA